MLIGPPYVPRCSQRLGPGFRPTWQGLLLGPTLGTHTWAQGCYSLMPAQGLLNPPAVPRLSCRTHIPRTVSLWSPLSSVQFPPSFPRHTHTGHPHQHPAAAPLRHSVGQAEPPEAGADQGAARTQGPHRGRDRADPPDRCDCVTVCDCCYRCSNNECVNDWLRTHKRRS